MHMAKEGAWLSPNVFIVLQDADTNPSLASELNRAKVRTLQEALKNTLKFAKRYNVKVAWGTDMLGARAAYDNMMQEFVYRAPYFTNLEQLKQVTSGNAELLAMSGNRTNYQDGPLGVIKPGAYADLLILEGNPLDDINVMLDYENNFKVIMKDGKVYKNTLQ